MPPEKTEEDSLNHSPGPLKVDVDIPSLSSSLNSSLTPSPTTGIPESSSSRPSSLSLSQSQSHERSITSSSLPQLPSLNVRFAPLPQIPVRKRRSTTPLGIAARSQLMRRRRAGVYDAEETPAQVHHPMWTPEELEMHARRRAVEAAKAIAAEDSVQEDSHDDPEDAFVALGKIVKGASKNWWRKVKNKDGSGKDGQLDGDGSMQGGRGGGSSNELREGEQLALSRRPSRPTVVIRSPSDPTMKVSKAPTPILRSSTPILRSSTPTLRSPTPLRPPTPLLRSPTPVLLEPLVLEEEQEQEQEEGGVWEEEVGNPFPRDVGQTETIVEGRGKYSWAAAVSVPSGSKGNS